MGNEVSHESDIDCNYSNSVLTKEEWGRIEAVSKNDNHLNKNSDLQELIKTDMETLEKYNIEIKQIINLFEKIKLHIASTKSIEKNDDDIKNLNKVYDNIDTRGWCLKGSPKYLIFDDKITVYYLYYGGSERCCFQSESDKKYHGYDYGASDYIFVKGDEILHIGSLLMHSIEKHNFFQDTDSKFRVDPEKLIKFFNMKSYNNYETDCYEDKYVEYFYSSCSNGAKSILSNGFDDDLKNLDEYDVVENQDYIVRTKKNEFDVFVLIKNEIKKDYIEILDGRLYGYGFSKGWSYCISNKKEVTDKYITEKEKNIDWFNL